MLKGRAAGATGVLGKPEGPWRVNGRSALGCPPARGTALWALAWASRPLGSACQCGDAAARGAGWGQSRSRNALLEDLPARRPCGRRPRRGLLAGAEGVKRSSAAGVSLPRGVELHSHGFSFLTGAGGEGLSLEQVKCPEAGKQHPGPLWARVGLGGI